MVKQVTLLIIAVLIGVGAGFFLGRRFPAHHYVLWRSDLLYDTTTGKICNPVITTWPNGVDPEMNHAGWPRCQ